MGWVNYILVQSLKIAVETNREVEELAEYEEKSLSAIIEEKEYDVRPEEIKANKLTLKELAELVKSHELALDLVGLHFDKLFLFWLKCRNIEYEIKSEYNIKKEQLEKEGYRIIEMV